MVNFGVGFVPIIVLIDVNGCLDGISNKLYGFGLCYVYKIHAPSCHVTGQCGFAGACAV